MKKTFVKITNKLVCKNKLQKQILENMEELDHTLFPRQEKAILLVNLAFKNAVNNYNGTAKKPILNQFKGDEKTLVFQVDDVVQISVYDVVVDLTV
ncbi:MAG: hypothetical protein ACOVLC_06170 [Flavobacterium sp.]